MMSKARADLGFSDALDEFNPTEWSTKEPRTTNTRPEDAETTRKAAEATGFKSREPGPPAPFVEALQPAELARDGGGQGEAPVRRRRTGRNAQFNLKARPETIAAFTAIADRQGWGFGETFEYAVEALERQLDIKS